jgi:hypothetical protein
MVFGLVSEFSRLPLSVPWALHCNEVNGARVGSWRGCLTRSFLGGDIFSCGLLIKSGVLHATRWSMLEKVPRVTALWGWPSLEANLSKVES